jgi:hypothetical protein
MNEMFHIPARLPRKLNITLLAEFCYLLLFFLLDHGLKISRNIPSQPLMSVGLTITVYPHRLPGLPPTTAANKFPLRAPTSHAHQQLQVAKGVKYPFELLPTPQPRVQLPATSSVRHSVAFLPTQQISASAGVSLQPQPRAQLPAAGARHQYLFPAAPYPQAQVPASTRVRPAVTRVQHTRLPGLVSVATTHPQAQALASTGVRQALKATLLDAQHPRLAGLVSPHIHVPVADIDQKYAATGKFTAYHDSNYTSEDFFNGNYNNFKHLLEYFRVRRPPCISCQHTVIL